MRCCSILVDVKPIPKRDGRELQDLHPGFPCRFWQIKRQQEVLQLQEAPWLHFIIAISNYMMYCNYRSDMF